jgi:hypothetical protein
VKLKYVVIERDGEEGVIMFTPFLLHRDVAGNHEIKSAGFCELEENETWLVNGRSDSLACRPRPQDAEVLKQYLLSKRLFQSINQPTNQQTL